MSKALYLCQYLPDPGRFDIRDSRKQWLGTFTRAAYTVTLTGPERTFSEGTAAVHEWDRSGRYRQRSGKRRHGCQGR